MKYINFMEICKLCLDKYIICFLDPAEALGLPFVISSNNGGTNFAIAGTTALDQEVFAKVGSISPASITITSEIQEFLDKKLTSCGEFTYFFLLNIIMIRYDI